MRIAIPNKGRLQEPVLNILKNAGFQPLYTDPRALILPTKSKDVEIVLIRPEDIPWIVETGATEVGITGHDFVVESGADVVEMLDLGFGKSKLVLAVPKNSGIRSVKDLDGKRVATKFVNITRKFLQERGVEAKIIKISGAAEIMPGLGAADAIVDVMSTGTTLRLHGLEPIETILESSARLIANKNKINEAEKVKTMIEGVMRGKEKKLLLMNVPDAFLEEVVKVLPAMGGPMISKIKSDTPMWEVMVAVDESELNEVIMNAKKAGARDILVLNVERLIP